MKRKKISPIDFITITTFYRYFYGSKINKGNAIKSRLPKMYQPMLKDLEKVIGEWMERWKEFKKQD